MPSHPCNYCGQVVGSNAGDVCKDAVKCAELKKLAIKQKRQTARNQNQFQTLASFYGIPMMGKTYGPRVIPPVIDGIQRERFEHSRKEQEWARKDAKKDQRIKNLLYQLQVAVQHLSPEKQLELISLQSVNPGAAAP